MTNDMTAHTGVEGTTTKKEKKRFYIEIVKNNLKIYIQDLSQTRRMSQ